MSLEHYSTMLKVATHLEIPCSVVTELEWSQETRFNFYFQAKIGEMGSIMYADRLTFPICEV